MSGSGAPLEQEQEHPTGTRTIHPHHPGQSGRRDVPRNEVPSLRLSLEMGVGIVGGRGWVVVGNMG
jgi:hypothetical protein